VPSKSTPFRTDVNGREICNKLLLALSPQAFDLIRQYLEFTDLPLRFELRRPEVPAQFAYFLNQGITSLIVETEDGRTAEVSVVGKEGMACASFVVGLRRSPLREMMQLDGNGFRVAFAKLQDALERSSELQRVLARYAVFQGMEIAQIAGCNRLHDGGQRLARWLLMVQDRGRVDSIPATQDFLSILLGTTRPNVSAIASDLQRKGAIKYARGQIRIVHRKKLEAASCECYRILANWVVD
jgi:CRP-like cAMP-binding protein